MQPDLDSVHSRPRVRVISVLDSVLPRYLSADISVFTAMDIGVMPMCVGVRLPGTDAAEGLPGAALERLTSQVAGFDRTLGGRVPCVRVGHLPSPDVVDAVAELLQNVARAGVVICWDPELCDRDGRPRVSDRVVTLMRQRVLPHIDVLACNATEAALLTQRTVESPSTMRDACYAFRDREVLITVITGAHLEGFPRDLYYDGSSFEELGADRIPNITSLVGAGGIFSAVLTAGIISGENALDAAAHARSAVKRAIASRRLVRADGWYTSAAVGSDASPGIWVANAGAVG